MFKSPHIHPIDIQLMLTILIIRMYVRIYNKEIGNLYINPRNFFQVRKWGFIVQVRFILSSKRFPYCGFIRDELHVRNYRQIVRSSLPSKYRFKSNSSFLSFNQFFNYDMKIIFTLQNFNLNEISYGDCHIIRQH